MLTVRRVLKIRILMGWVHKIFFRPNIPVTAVVVVHSALLESFDGFRCTYMTDEANAKLYVA